MRHSHHCVAVVQEHVVRRQELLAVVLKEGHMHLAQSLKVTHVNDARHMQGKRENLVLTVGIEVVGPACTHLRDHVLSHKLGVA